jgi:hypothetical protein
MARNAILRAPVLRPALLVLALTGCGGTARAPLPMRPAPIPYADTLPIPQPAEREVIEIPKLLNQSLSGEVGRTFSIRKLTGNVHGALNLTAFDGVVNSAWYENRLVRGVTTPDEVLVGPTTLTGPSETGDLEVVAAKVEGISPGFTIRDANGDRFIVKFDPKGFLHLASSADVISNRLFYAAGYHVPEDYIFVFDPDRLVVGEGAMITNEHFTRRPMVDSDFEQVLGRTDSLPDGRYLAVASRFVPGIPKGPFYFEGVRRDDPNDWYHHEYRRELRGLLVVSSWVNHVDMRFANTMDAYVQPGYLRHYLIDFAATLGSGTIRPHNPREGAEYNFDFWRTMGRMFTLGFYREDWEGAEFTVIDPSIGWLRGATFLPGEWAPNWPNESFAQATPPDAYWGAKLVGAFTDEAIDAAVAAGQLPSEFAADTLAAILRVRRDRIVKYWYAAVSPVENVSVEGVQTDRMQVAFDDYGVLDGGWTGDSTSYVWEMRDDARALRTSGGITARPGAYRQTILVPLPASVGSAGRTSDDSEDLAVISIQVIRPGSTRLPAPAVAYLKWDADSARYTVVGLSH